MTRKPTPIDDEAWRALTQGVKPIERTDRRSPEPAPLPRINALREQFYETERRTRAEPQPLPPIKSAATESDEAHLSGLDRKRAQRMRRGDLPIEGRLDLHGYTEHQAWNAVRRFILEAQAVQKRSLVIVTGKGGAGQKGLLRMAVPRWLIEEPLRPFIAAWCPAQPKDGGEGAFYILLRRLRP